MSNVHPPIVIVAYRYPVFTARQTRESAERFRHEPKGAEPRHASLSETKMGRDFQLLKYKDLPDGLKRTDH